MCDTQVLLHGGQVWLAKNSDREPGEAQAVVRLPAVSGDRQPRLRLTHIEIPQVANRHAVILSKPVWMWGAEMGFNDQGLAIGNEALFTRGRQLAPALLGMDLLRLALERCRRADEAVERMGEWLSAYGQGGPAGFRDRRFHYDSSFLLADPTQAWIMETAGREWVARRVRHFAAISNRLQIGRERDRSSPGAAADFAAANDTRLVPWLAGSAARQALGETCLAVAAARPRVGFADLIAQLRRHQTSAAPLAGSNRDVCLHAAGPVRRSQTTASLVVRLGEGEPRAAATGSSAPCLSVFRPVNFDPVAWSVLSPAADRAPLWQDWEAIHRAALFDAGFRRRLRQAIARAEAPLCRALDAGGPGLAAHDQDVAAVARDILAWPRPTPSRRWPPAAWFWSRQPISG